VGDAGSTPAPVPNLKTNQMSTQANDAAFARPSFYHDSYGRPDKEQDGLTKREYFAAMAMQGLFAVKQHNDSLKLVAKVAVGMADFLIEELNRNNQQTPIV
jgi:hypothetical protein